MWTYLHTAASFMCFAVARNQAGIVNLALNKPAFQSSTLNSWVSSVAGNAVDGNSNSDWTRGSCSHTYHLRADKGQWWMVDLLQEHYITKVAIVNRQDDNKVDRLRDFVIETFWSNPSMFPDAKRSVCEHYNGIFPASGTVVCTEPLIGRFVRIRKLLPFVHNSMMLCEVSVMGTDTTINEGYPRTGRVYTNIPGKHVTANLTTTYENTSKLHCAVTCLSDGDCQAFQFRDVTRTCNIVKNTWETDAFITDVRWKVYFM